jgi:DMSO/TMAO reductase YedYZ molybdopterin-dependent catalytic subunit
VAKPCPEYWAKQMRQVMERSRGTALSNAEWAGVSLAQVLERAGLKPTAKDVVFTGADHGPDETVGIRRKSPMSEPYP